MSAATTRRTPREPLAGHVRRGDFRHRAACRSVDPEVFFPSAEAGRELERQVAVAKAVCGDCRVRDACLSWALTHLPDGIAGGMTEHERRGEQARRGRERRGARLPRPRVPRRPVNIGAGNGRRAPAEHPHSDALDAPSPGPTTANQSRAAAGEGSTGGNRAPLRISHNDALARTRAEGHRD